MKITKINQILKAAYYADDVVLMRGLHGIGKTEKIRQYAEENNFYLETLILSLMDQGDLIGIPNINNGVTTWAAPDWIQNIQNKAWPKKIKFEDLDFSDKDFEKMVKSEKPSDNVLHREYLNNLYNDYYGTDYTEPLLTNQDNVSCKLSKESVLFVDEYSRAGADIHNSTMQLILDKRLHNHILPYVNGKQTQIIAADNPSDGDYHVTELDPAKMDRFLIIDVEVDPEGWLVWARENNINNIVRSFIIDNMTKLHFASEDDIGATPRSWTKLGKFMDLAQNNSLDDIFILDIMRGKIGSALASQFYVFYKNFSNNISIEDIENMAKKAFMETGDIEKTGEVLHNKLENLESISKLEHVNTLFDKNLNIINDPFTSLEDLVPLFALLYSFELETLTSFLKDKKANDKVSFYNLMKKDKDKNLAKKIKSKVAKQ